MKHKSTKTKFMFIADTNIGYIQTILPCYGIFTTEKLVRPNLPISTRIVLQLCQNLSQSNPEAAGYHIYTDHYFICIPLADALLSTKCHITGPIQTNGKFIPNNIKNRKIAENDIVAYRRRHITTGLERQTNQCCSTCTTTTMKNITKSTRREGTNIVKPNVG
ncbi:uncharacterized protein LOC117241346 [Bombus vosnesenskii]|uniref:Uncharacterized protein LOC117240326 n=1 Tax=Bombus vosnesenskii TaxID=207650 RepID=A0A6J3LH51_9HYME|nr:uncharacterized protein LOC117240326 [Bombus vosnesenskii]XP_033362199.1 uncharacterized protein LOC117240329 [Bombus vosnesenskii]XP_033362831.1 uncharacterized protein LOC117240913 [Bombus vosnesenskii]XP_033363078.1 uncharacterized protein LOC117241222 [Bombus vosnesenskii]XP_033363080.1 uncharacterized protein LOC117241224 [Bombus vosnesenskii]XP_033363089.1 uncharacterized protein LOC117241232 [Bombus vosnesenskii]XP_033363178.1 uncharacterized protein LOC117241345 [Bombus vosnesenski